MPISTSIISKEQAEKIRLLDESPFADVKAREKTPSAVSENISAFANTDGGDIYIGITDKERKWIGFDNIEAANAHLQVFENLFPLGTNFKYEFLRCDDAEYPGLVLYVQINKTQGIVNASNGIPYIRRGAQNLPVNTPEKMKRLERTKGISSFETEKTNAPKELITDSTVAASFVQVVVPTTTPEAWLRKQMLICDEQATVAGVLLFSDEPQAILQKQCGIKIYRYKTREIEGFRDVLADTPQTIEGCLYEQIRNAVRITQEITESIPKLGKSGFEKVKYPPETLHEILTNAVLHRDYSIKDDIHVRIFDDRVEIQSPGMLPAHITIENILDERFARNGSIVRILNKFPDPPNKDVGEGLNTAFAKMVALGLKQPVITQQGNSVLVLIKHEPLASPEQMILSYLEDNQTIRNKEARELTHVGADFQIRNIFKRMAAAGQIEKVKGSITSNTLWKKKR